MAKKAKGKGKAEPPIQEVQEPPEEKYSDMPAAVVVDDGYPDSGWGGEGGNQGQLGGDAQPNPTDLGAWPESRASPRTDTATWNGNSQTGWSAAPSPAPAHAAPIPSPAPLAAPPLAQAPPSAPAMAPKHAHFQNRAPVPAVAHGMKTPSKGAKGNVSQYGPPSQFAPQFAEAPATNDWATGNGGWGAPQGGGQDGWGDEDDEEEDDDWGLPPPAMPPHRHSHAPAQGPAWMSWGQDASRARTVSTPAAAPKSPPTQSNAYAYASGWHQQGAKQSHAAKPAMKQQSYAPPPQQQRQASGQSQQSWGESAWGADGGYGAADGWGAGGGAADGWGDSGNDGWGDEEDEEDDYDDGGADDYPPKSVRFDFVQPSAPQPPAKLTRGHNRMQSAPPLGATMGASYNMPSKTLAHAYKGDARPTQLSGAYARNGMQDYADVRFNESHGAALAPVHEALYGRRARRAKDRMHWAFPPDQDERVEMLLSWIQAVAHGLAAFGLHKFLQSRERGALFANADYVSPEDPAQPAFDWLTFDQLQPTRDRILQESVSTYDPATTVVVFVFLPSASGRSMAVWRRKLAVPNNIRLAYIAEITQTMKTLKKDYVCMVDELPNDHRRMSKPPASPPAPKKKKKWWKLNIRW